MQLIVSETKATHWIPYRLEGPLLTGCQGGLLYLCRPTFPLKYGHFTPLLCIERPAVVSFDLNGLFHVLVLSVTAGE